MGPAEQLLLDAFETHDAGSVRAALAAGASATAPINGEPPVAHLLGHYVRSDDLPACLRLLFEQGAELEDRSLMPVLLDDGPAVAAAVSAEPRLLMHRTSMRSAFTSLAGVTLLHVAAEYGNRSAARALIEAGADVNARADVTDDGLNGHTPLFHAVNSHANRSAPLMRDLLTAGARSDIHVAGIEWGRGYPWQTTFFDVTPVSYAQMGLLPQVHRREVDIYDNIRALLAAAGRTVPPLPNVPNRYVRGVKG